MKVDCERCSGTGYRHLDGVGDRARAEACRCITDCSHCHGQLFVMSEVDGYEVAISCPACVPTRTRVRLFNEAGLPAEYGRKTVPGYVDQGTGNQGQIKTLMARYQSSFTPENGRGLVLMGKPGTGKTHLLCGLVHYFTLELGIPCRFVDFFHLTARIRATFDDRSESSQEAILQSLVDVPVLAIDELGKGLGTSWEQNVIDQLISRRYNAGRIVLATTNYLPSHLMAGAKASDAQRGPLSESLEERVGVRIHSRLVEMCDFHHVKGPDHRPTMNVG